MCSGKAFSEHISELIINSNVFHLKIPSKNLISNEMIINFNVLCSGMKHRIGSNGQGRIIVTPKFAGIGEKDA